MDLISDRTDRIDKVFWDRFVEMIFESLDYKTPSSAKDIEKILINKKWGLPKISSINKAINEDLKDRVVKIGKSKWIKKAN
jgi:hypothetical protein